MRSRTHSFRVAWWVCACAVLLGVGVSPALAGRRVEAVGAVPLVENADAASQSAARTAAFEKAIWEAVMRVAEEMRAADLAAKEGRAATEKLRKEEEQERLRSEKAAAKARADLDPVPFFGGDSNSAEGPEAVAPVESREEVPPTDSDLAPRDILRKALGKQPRGYTNRYRISEDRGLRASLLTGGEDPRLNAEYVVVAEVDVDVKRIRQALVKAGVIDAIADKRGKDASTELRLLILDPLNYRLLSQLQKVIEEDMENTTVLPLEFERGQSVLAVRTELSPETFARSLIRRLPAELHVKQATVRGDEIAMRFELRPAAEDTEASAQGVRKVGR